MTVYNRGIWQIDQESIARAVDVPDGQRVIGVRENWPMLSIDVMLEGPGLPEVNEAMVPPYVGRGLPDVDIKRRIAALAHELERCADSETDDRVSLAYGATAERLRGLLA